MTKTDNQLFPKIKLLCDKLVSEFSTISEERKLELDRLAAYISDQLDLKKTPKLLVVCTHNSRRSHFGQLWLAIGAAHFKLPAIETFSGGTETTAFNPRAVLALKKIGLKIESQNESSNNPLYEIQWQFNQQVYLSFSKKIADRPNPKSDFAAIMVCNSADEACPIVSGADFRIALPFEDPKLFDDTPLEAEKYDERLRHIGREMLYVLVQCQKK